MREAFIRLFQDWNFSQWHSTGNFCCKNYTTESRSLMYTTLPEFFCHRGVWFSVCFQQHCSLLSGDFNSHHGKWGSNLSNRNGRNLVGVIERFDYVILNKSIPTHFCLSGLASWNVLGLTIVSNSLASHSSGTISLAAIIR